ncbi:hypothetical protein BDEG_23294 [Batrachochytrium dendrobatidis JEL423]|uniref:Rap-GAP domain-containing protein n=1 Tax=Batrachochytrium dendrobatidis (strain JEL423) TaxID=403673 RepID=A0A177WJC5_BATDL|nr:hypothetical protein BDEG_23294 [Batrachochytrium dendrobatidis JEL423]
MACNAHCILLFKHTYHNLKLVSFIFKNIYKLTFISGLGCDCLISESILVHQNYLAPDSPRGPLAISLAKDGTIYKALIRSNLGTERLSVAIVKVQRSTMRKLFGLSPTLENIISSMGYTVPSHFLKLCKDSSLPSELLSMEERQVIRSYKFGVEYISSGQTTEEHALCNTHENASPAYKKFLTFLGETIELSGWRGYRAGLDVSGANNTGIQSVYTKWQGYEIMYHVATLLPHKPEDKQQLERKRHIGNDIVMIIFQDEKTAFDLSSITSHQNHVVALVTPEEEGYRIQIASKAGVPSFLPEIPDPPLIQMDAMSRDFFLHKLVNAERASYKAPSFAPKLSRTRSVLLYDIAVKFLG